MIISIDVGGTYTRVASFSFGGDFLNMIKFQTEQNYNNALNKIALSINELCNFKKELVEGIVFGIPGILNKEKNKIILTPNLLDWQNKNLVDDFKKFFDVDIFLSNDADLGGLGEAVFGAGKGFEIIAYLAIGTGFGGTRIVNNKIDASSQGFEVGHMIINFESKIRCGCGQYGCLETYVSGRAFKEKYSIESLSMCNDELILEEVSRYLAIGLVNIITLWSPDCIVLSGGVLNAGDKLVKPTLYNLQKYLKVFNIPQIKISELKDKANLFGGLHYFKLHNIFIK